MKIEYDASKDAANFAKHGLNLGDVEGFNWDSAEYQADTRKPYGETRIIATGYKGKRLHVVVFTLRAQCYRIISFRKANKRESKSYEEKNRIH